MAKRKLKSHRRRRLLIQAAAAALSNGYLAGFAGGRIFTGKSKYVCVPGLNCYSCPGALGSCPIGSLQATLGGRNYSFAFYVLGFLMIFGALFGRFVCGFLCPFGLVQDLLYKIPFFKKLKRLPGEKFLRRLRYPILLIFVIILPMFVVDLTGLGEPWFCKYICPAGTLEGGIPLVLANEGLRAAVGFLYAWKLAILAAVVFLSLLIWRPFCRYVCPLGAIYGMFNKFSLYRFRVDGDKCISCGKCQTTCGLDIPVWKKPNSADCVRCGECGAVCPTGAIDTVKLTDIISGMKKGEIK